MSSPWNNGRISRFVGDIFGAPLAASAARVLPESTFLGVLLFGRKRVCRSSTWCHRSACRVVRLSSFQPVDPHRELVDDRPSAGPAVRRRISPAQRRRHHRLPDRAMNRRYGRATRTPLLPPCSSWAQFVAMAVFRVVPHQEPPQGIRHEDDEAGRRGAGIVVAASCWSRLIPPPSPSPRSSPRSLP